MTFVRSREGDSGGVRGNCMNIFMRNKSEDETAQSTIEASRQDGRQATTERTTTHL